MRRSHPLTTALARLVPLATAAALAVTAGATGAPAVLVAGGVPWYDAAGERARVLALPDPTARADAAHPVCAADIDGHYPVACFPSQSHVDRYIAGGPPGGREIVLSGFGGTGASATGSPAVGRTCTGAGCSGTSTTWYSTTGANCTHAYPNNDYFKENVSTFYYAMNYALGVSNLNCNRMILYRDATQGGGGALDCGSTASTCGSGSVSYQSISWHNG
jgi:hypothetical protein